MTDPINKYLAETNRYPSNNMVWHVAKDVDGKFDPELLTDVAFGSSPAAKGHFIIEAFDKDRQRINTVSDANLDIIEPTRPTTNTFYSGRYWCAGLTSKRSSGKIFFSQILEDMDKAGKCYTENDPTAEEFNDPLDTDGGVIKIPEVGEIQQLEAIGNGVAVIADNGIWFIRGGDSKGFTPTSHIITKVSGFGSISTNSVVSLGSTILYWGKDGIFQLGYTELEGLQAQDLTETTIKTFYDEIPIISRKFAMGFHSAADMKVHWFYSSENPVNDEFRYKKNRVLTLNLQLSSFTTYSIGELNSDSPYLIGGFERPYNAATSKIDNILVNGNQVVVSADNVIVITLFEGSVDINIKGVSFVPITGGDLKFTFSDFRDESFKDWVSSDGIGIDAFSFAIPAYEIFDEPSREKRVTYVTTHFNRTETGFNADLSFTNPSGCLMQAQWDWSDSDTGGLQGAFQQIYRYNRVFIPQDSSDPFDYGQSILTTKTKLRGKGNALTLRFESEEGKDFQLIGWTTNATVKA